MQKQAPTLGKLLVMVVFAMSCFGLLLFLWLSFGGPVPLKPEGYRIEASFDEATTLATESEVRIAGVNVGKVTKKELQDKLGRTLVTLELDQRFAPIPEDTRAILRQKTLLGETYVELTPGDRNADKVEDGGRLALTNVEPPVQLDKIFQAFDGETRQAFQDWVAESARAIRGGTGTDLNDALGNLDDFATDGAGVLEVLDEQDRALRQLIRNTGGVFEALTRREGELRALVENSGDTFDAIASRDRALADTFRVFPTFLDESRITLGRLEGFSREARPLVRDLQPVADDLAPTIRDVGDLAPDLEQLFRDLDPLIDASRTNTPELVKVLEGAGPVFDGLDVFLKELNPILAFANFQPHVLSTFISHGAAAFGGSLDPIEPGGPRRHYLRAYGSINSRSLSLNAERPDYDRGNAYLAPNGYTRAERFGVIESFDCAGGEVRDPVDNGIQEAPPCFEQPASLFDGNRFPKPARDGTPELVPPPANTSVEGTEPADPNR